MKVLENKVKEAQIQNNVKDGQSEPKIQNDVMIEKRCTNEMSWKPLEHGLTDVSGARGVAAPVPRKGQCRHERPRTGQCRHEKERAAREGTHEPRKKRADLQLVKERSQQQARTGEDLLRQEDCEPTDGDRHTRAVMCIRWENKSSSSQQKRSEESTAPYSMHKATGLTMSWASGPT